MVIDTSAIAAIFFNESDSPHYRERIADQARRAWRRFGKGRHPAGLNFGDCFSYALAALTGEPLLFKGNDFKQTDVEVA